MKKILIANRGEIALRIMRTARRMGISTVAVYSEADRNAPHVKYADEAILLGPPPSNQSYLLGDKIIEKAKHLGVDGIHPGYGFLSENAAFAKAVDAAGMTFIGPDTHAIEIMGSKLAAKETVMAYDVPMVPGVDEAIDPSPEGIAKAKKIAKEIGFPILIKASAGGGGKGMRLVEDEANFESQMERAVSEAISSFGDGAVFIEKFVTSPRHIEIQVLADKHGNVVHLFERECSIQRRHQKVIEEAPSSVLSSDIREKMGAAAVLVAKSCDYVGAGTVEFLLDANHDFYFLEMNTRLQVEHPVTEMITGIDLVEMQIRVARGEKLPFTQEDLTISGHALELRIYAEDPTENFLPSVGTLEKYRIPTGDGIRVDDGFTEGMEIPIYYDPMLAKLVVFGENRAAAIEKMLSAIADYEIEGIANTLPFGQFVFQHEAFQSGHFDTSFVGTFFTPEKLKESHKTEAFIAGALAKSLLIQKKEQVQVVKMGNDEWWTKR